MPPARWALNQSRRIRRRISFLRVLEGLLAVVADAAAQPHDAQPFPDIHLIVHTDAAARLTLCAVAAIVVAMDIQNGGPL